jgi:Ca2+-binding EF-hand superfamily protein
MSSISSVSGSSAWAAYASANKQKTQTSSVVDKLFEKLDTNQQGFLDKSELQAALSTNVSGNSGQSASADEMFSAMDADGDGKITKQELGNTLESLMGKMDNLAASMRVHGGRDKQGADEGFTKDQLTQMAQDTSGTDSKRSTFMSTIAANFEQADSNGDGKVNRDEAMAYAKANGLEVGGSHGAGGGPQGAGGAQAAGGPPPADAASDASSTDSSSADSTATASTDPADTNGDGKVSAKEAVEYLLSQLAKTESPSDSSESSSSTSSKAELDAQVSRQILHLVKAYGLGSTAANDASSSAQTLSASA